MSTDEFAGLTEHVRELSEGRTTSEELVTSAIERIQASQSTINAFRWVRGERALDEARDADRRLAAGERLPLLGVPLAVKDDTDVAGLPTLFGCNGELAPAAADGEAVRRLRAAGAVIVGKTNSCELGQWPFTEDLPSERPVTPGPPTTPRAAPPAAPRLPSPQGSYPRRSARTAPDRSASRPPGPISSASSHSADASPCIPTPTPSRASL